MAVADCPVRCERFASSLRDYQICISACVASEQRRLLLSPPGAPPMMLSPPGAPMMLLRPTVLPPSAVMTLTNGVTPEDEELVVEDEAVGIPWGTIITGAVVLSALYFGYRLLAKKRSNPRRRRRRR